jgi:hypothetical protein
VDQQNLKISRADLEVRENEGQVTKFEVDKKLLQYFLVDGESEEEKTQPGKSAGSALFLTLPPQRLSSFEVRPQLSENRE